MRNAFVLSAALVAIACGGPAAAQIVWEREFYDLGAARTDAPPPDLVLPMPCGGAMGFQRVDVAVDAANPLADKRVRLGQSGTETGFIDYLRQDYLRGAFTSADAAGSHYYVARYELTELQHAALTDKECSFTPSIRMTVPKLALSWFDANELARGYTEWLRKTAPDALPEADGQPGFLRLPTEPEWEFAARGGEAVDPLDFGTTRHPMSEELGFYAQFDQSGPGPVGARAPNPLGLHDMLGNAEELMFEPFRLNAVGHPHGQIGGIITRGGSYASSAADMRSARRSEWPPFNSTTGEAQAQGTFGMRLVLSAQVMTRDAQVAAIDDAWRRSFEGGSEEASLPTDALAGMIEGELDPARRSALEAIQLDLAVAQDAATRAQEAQIVATLEMAATTLLSIRRLVLRIAGMQNYLEDARVDLAETTIDSPGFDAELLEEYRGELEATIADFEVRVPEFEGFLRDLVGSYREALTLLTDARPETLAAQTSVLRDRMDARGNATMLVTFEQLQPDIEAMRATPDMDAEELLRVALEPPE